MIGVAVLGSTGSIGVSTLDVLARHPDRYRVVALTAHSNVERMAQQCRAVQPQVAVMVDKSAAAALRVALADMPKPPEIWSGAQALETVAALPEVEYLMAAIVGAAGLLSTLTAARAGKRILLANKEALVVAGAIVMRTAAECGATLLPIDSEHNAIFQCLPGREKIPPAPLLQRGGEESLLQRGGEESLLQRGGEESLLQRRGEELPAAGVDKILLTASGGPFRNTPVADLAHITPAQAVAHPNWSMGRKISVDSATMMNKGLELIEACWLFATTPDRIQVVIHPQSVIHSLVQYCDGSVLAQLGNPDMRTPIAHALAWPARMTSGVKPLDLFTVGQLTFEPPAPERFPCLELAYQAARTGGTAPAILNAANEIAVAAFLAERIGFTAISRVVAATLDQLPAASVATDASGLEQLLAADAAARACAEHIITALMP